MSFDEYNRDVLKNLTAYENSYYAMSEDSFNGSVSVIVRIASKIKYHSLLVDKDAKIIYPIDEEVKKQIIDCNDHYHSYMIANCEILPLLERREFRDLADKFRRTFEPHCLETSWHGVNSPFWKGEPTPLWINGYRIKEKINTIFDEFSNQYYEFIKVVDTRKFYNFNYRDVKDFCIENGFGFRKNTVFEKGLVSSYKEELFERRFI